MKNINWTRIALYVVGVVIVFRVFSSIYMSGYFHPKEVSVNGITLTAPKDYYLVGVYSSNNKYHFDVFSPLKLNFGTKYFIENNQSIGVTFANMGKKRGRGMKDILAAKTSKVTFNKMISEWKKKEDTDVILFKSGYGQCSDIYQISEKTEENMFLDLFLFDYEKKMMISLLVTHRENIKESLDEICSSSTKKQAR